MPRARIVDDDPAIRPVLADAIREAGYHVETACTGIEALERVRGKRLKQQVHEPCSKPIHVAAVLAFVGHNITGAAKDVSAACHRSVPGTGA
jgi:CheY-like chemotaxis protein